MYQPRTPHAAKNSPMNHISTSLLILLPLPIPPNPPIQHPLPPSSPPAPTPPQYLPPPTPKLIAPPPTHQHPTNHIHHPDQQPEEPFSLLPHRQQYGFDVEFEEDPGDGPLGDRVGLRSGGVLVRDNCVAGAVIRWKNGGRIIRVGYGWRRGGRRAGVDCRDNGEVILVFVEVVGGYCVSAVEGVEEGGVERTKGEFVDDVGEVECCCFFPPPWLVDCCACMKCMKGRKEKKRL